MAWTLEGTGQLFCRPGMVSCFLVVSSKLCIFTHNHTLEIMGPSQYSQGEGNVSSLVMLIFNITDWNDILIHDYSKHLH